MLKKITSLLLSVAMLLTLTTPSMAASLEETEAAITEVTQPPEPPMEEPPEAPPAPPVEENNYAELAAAGENPSGTCGANLKWELNTANGTLTISGTGTMYNYNYYSGSRAPWDSYRSNMKTLILEEGITTIGSYAFKYCSGLRGSLTLPSSLTSIGGQAFSDCSGLTGSLTLPSGLTSINAGAFAGTQLSSVQISTGNPNYSSSTDGVLFNKDKTALIYYPTGKKGTYAIPYSVTTIGGSAFSGCSGLESLTLPSGVTTIGHWAFAYCSGLGSLTLPSSLTTIEGGAFAYCSGLTGSLTLPSGLTTIGESAFQDCSGLTGSLTLPSGLTTIGESAFYCCSGLTGNLTVPSGLTTIGKAAFSRTQLSSVQVSTENPNYTSSTDGVLFNKDRTALLYYPANRKGTYTIPDSVTTIGDCAFDCCSGLTGNLTLPSGVTTIGDYAFYYCSGLTGNLTLPSGVTSIGDLAFVSTQLSSVQVSTENPNYSSSTDGVLFNKDKTALIYYPTGRKGSYAIPDSVTTIGEYAFLGSSLTGSLMLPSGLTKIGRYAFSGCRGLTGAYFKGNAPDVYAASDNSPSFPHNLPLYYNPATSGWSTPTWNGYNAMPYEEPCVVSFDANGGVGAIAGQTVEKGKSFVLTNEIPSRYGYAFQGWASSQTATTVEYQPGATVSFPADQILYAVWREETFSVKLDQVTAKEAIVSVNAPSSGVVLVAVYDKDGKLIQMGSQTMTKNTTSVTIPLNLEQLPEGGQTKVFLLDRGLWMPLCPTDGL